MAIRPVGLASVNKNGWLVFVRAYHIVLVDAADSLTTLPSLYL